jgi:hypothetical protein
MSRFRYNTSGNWYKGNLHMHSVASDGGRTFSELADMYAGAGYDFLCRTDHGIASNVAADATEYPLLWLDGTEIDGQDNQGQWYHIACIGKFRGMDYDVPFAELVQSVKNRGGFLILAHPYWCGNSLDDALRWGVDAVEVYNHICHWLNGKGCGAVHWQAVLASDPEVLGVAVDDAHLSAEHPGWNGGWISVNASECTPETLNAGIRAGNFYSSMGPEFHAMEHEGQRVTVRTSPIQFAKLVGPGPKGKRTGSFEGITTTETTFEIPAEWEYAYIEIEDVNGRTAWTNSLFTARE